MSETGVNVEVIEPQPIQVEVGGIGPRGQNAEPHIMVQPTPSGEWNFVHALGHLPYGTKIYNEAGEEVDGLIVSTLTTIKVKFENGISMAGKVVFA